MSGPGWHPAASRPGRRPPAPASAAAGSAGWTCATAAPPPAFQGWPAAAPAAAAARVEALAPQAVRGEAPVCHPPAGLWTPTPGATSWQAWAEPKDKLPPWHHGAGGKPVYLSIGRGDAAHPGKIRLPRRLRLACCLQHPRSNKCIILSETKQIVTLPARLPACSCRCALVSQAPPLAETDAQAGRRQCCTLAVACAYCTVCPPAAAAAAVHFFAAGHPLPPTALPRPPGCA